MTRGPALTTAKAGQRAVRWARGAGGLGGGGGGNVGGGGAVSRFASSG